MGWQNSTLLQGDVAEAVTTLKEQDGGDLAVLGSGSAVRLSLVDCQKTSAGTLLVTYRPVRA